MRQGTIEGKRDGGERRELLVFAKCSYLRKEGKLVEVTVQAAP